MTQTGPFSGDTENVMRWVSIGAIVLALGAIVLLIAVLARNRAWRITIAAKWTLMVGLFLLPASTMLMSNVVGFHNVPRSCGECHTMDPWISDMKDSKSTTLAAKHYQNRWINETQCYTCHTGYGLGGNIEAKIGGLRHVTHYYVTGVPKEIKIHAPFPNATCLHCHVEAVGFKKVSLHEDPRMKPKILSGEISCLECHDSPHPRAVKKPVSIATCLQCHANTESFRKVDVHEDPELKPKILSGDVSCLECHESAHRTKKK